MIENQNGSIFQTFNNLKLTESYHTNTSSELFHKKRLSINTCVSSVNIPESSKKLQPSKHLKLAIKLLHSKENNSKSDIIEEVKSNFEDQKQTLQFCQAYPKFEYFPSEYQIRDIDFMNLIFGRYLEWMGYRSEKNRKHILSRARFILKTEELGKAMKFYERFGETSLSKEERFELLKGTCINGWQYFVAKMCENIKKERKSENSE